VVSQRRSHDGRYQDIVSLQLVDLSYQLLDIASKLGDLFSQAQGESVSQLHAQSRQHEIVLIVLDRASNVISILSSSNDATFIDLPSNLDTRVIEVLSVCSIER